jgi:glycosyltransferase involved in cell wall biosynthesis
MSKHEPSLTIVQDYLCARAGSERVAIAMAGCFPGARFLTALYAADRTYEEARSIPIETLPINRFAPFRRNHRLAFPLLAPSFARVRLPKGVVICSSTGWSHGVNASGRKIAYWHSPAKWLYSSGTYGAAGSRVASVALGALRSRLERWDRDAVRTIDRHLCNSTAVRDRLRKIYDIEAEVVFPPGSQRRRQQPERPDRAPDPGFILCVSRLLPYKNVGAVLDAMSLLPDLQLVVVGRGPLESDLKQKAPANVTFLRDLKESQLWWLYDNCKMLVHASYEDFGLTPVEAASSGRPSVVIREGGFLDTVVHGSTGLFFDTLAPVCIADAISRCVGFEWDPREIRAHAEIFSFDSFCRRLRTIVGEEAAA